MRRPRNAAPDEPGGRAPSKNARASAMKCAYLSGPLATFGRRLNAGELGSVPVLLGLGAIWIVFQTLNSQFLSARNLSDISVDMVGTGMIAVGIVFVLLLGEIDLSVGSVSGLAAAAFAVLNVNHGLGEGAAVLVAILTGSVTGAVQGFFFAKVGVPSFVVTLAGLLSWNGLMLYFLGSTGTINLDDQGLVASMTSFYFNDVAVAYAVAAAGTAAYFLVSYHDSRRRRIKGLSSRPLGDIALRTAVLAVAVFSAAYELNRFQGLPLALLIFLLVIVALECVLRRTLYGRDIYALGGGVEAARKAGLKIVGVQISVFTISGTMAAVGGLFLASRVTSASQTSGSGNLLINAIAAAVIGGTSLFGGRGSTWSALLGVLVIQSIASGVALLGIQTAAEYMITGGVLLLAVVIDSLSRRAQKAHGRI